MQASRLVSFIAPASLATLAAIAGCGPYGCPTGFVESDGRCLDPDAGVDAATGEDGGAEPEDASIDARAPLADANIDGGSEACNGMDDDGDTRVDEGDGRECAQGAVEACSTECGTGGFRRCDSACMWEREGGCYADAEVCNYCDDDGDGSIDDERPLATGMTMLSAAACTDWDGESLASPFVSCAGSGPWSHPLLDTAVTSDAAASWRVAPLSVGWNGFAVTASISLRKSTSGQVPGEGWALVLRPPASGSPVGDAGAALGVPSSADGLAIEWRFSETAGTDGADRISVRSLSSFGGSPIASRLAVPASADWGVGRTALTQTLRVEYEPEDLTTAADEQTLRIYANGELVITMRNLPGDVRYFTRAFFAPNTPVEVGVTAATGVSSTTASLSFGAGADSAEERGRCAE